MPAPVAADRQRLVGALRSWTAHSRRDLPWRRTRDPWAVLVSELMLQQTQVIRVAARYPEFLQRFPDPAACAAASVGAVVDAWAGLGYNRRAVHLHAAATIMADHHDGQVPRSLDDLQALPGIGPYTARAVLAFAYEQDTGVVDVNAARVLSRAVQGRRLTPGEAQELADALVPPGAAWEWNQAILDLGATVCRKRSPRCGACPLEEVCTWARAGRPSPDPAHGSAGTGGRQSRFEGSDRQGRGRLVDALRTGPIDVARLPDASGWPDNPERARRIADGLVSDGLAEYVDGSLALPA